MRSFHAQIILIEYEACASGTQGDALVSQCANN